MQKNIFNIIVMSLLLFITFQLLISSKSIFDSVLFSFNIWKNSIFPSLFPFFVLSDVLVNYGFVELTGNLFKPIIYKLFKVKGEAAYIFIMSMLSGFPSSAKYIRELYFNKKIDENEGTKILMFTHFSNPLFILGTISISFLNNKQVGILVLLCHYITNIIIGIIFKNYCPSKNENIKFSLKDSLSAMTKYQLNNKKTFGNIFNHAITTSIDTLLLILGTMTTFLIITTIIDNNLNINDLCQAILNGLIEMTQGLKYVSLLNVSLKIKAIISTILISFGGICVHLQIISILSDTKIKYLPFLLSRIIHSVISGFLVYILFDFFY